MKRLAKYVESAGLIDEYTCTCGWKSGPYYDGAEFAYIKWQKHAKEASKLPQSPQPTVFDAQKDG